MKLEEELDWMTPAEILDKIREKFTRDRWAADPEPKAETPITPEGSHNPMTSDSVGSRESRLRRVLVWSPTAIHCSQFLANYRLRGFLFGKSYRMILNRASGTLPGTGYSG